MEYEVQIGEKRKAFGPYRANAMAYARKQSEKAHESAYVVVTDDTGTTVGHIAYHSGFRDHTEGQVA